MLSIIKYPLQTGTALSSKPSPIMNHLNIEDFFMAH